MCKNWLIGALTRSEAGVVNYDAELNSKELNSKELNSKELNSKELNSKELNSTELNSTELNSTELNSTELNSTELNSTELNSTELKTLALACKNLVSENINNHTQGSATTACPSLYFSGKGQHQARLPITGLPITGFIAIGLMLCLLLAGLWATPAEAHGSHTTSHLNNSCYVDDNIGTVGTEPPCLNMLIVCQYDDAGPLYPNRPNSCPVGQEKYSIHRPSEQGVVWTWTYDAVKNDYYKDQGGDKYYFGQHDGEKQIFTGQVTSMRHIFKDDNHFNADIGNWDTSHVINMTSMFWNASVFNQDIGGWDISQLNLAGYMFTEAIAFNQDIGGWDTSQVIGMKFIFSEASAFNQDLSHWDFSSLAVVPDSYEVYALQDIFYTPVAYGAAGYGSALSVDNYDAFLTSFKQSGIDLPYYRFSGGSSRFCEVAEMDGGSYQDPSYHSYYNDKTTYDCHPRITRVTLDNVLSTSLALTVTFSEPVFSEGGGALETDDFMVEISATKEFCTCGAFKTQHLASSISQIGNSYTLDVDITGTLQADQVIKVSPAYERIFDVNGNAASHTSN